MGTSNNSDFVIPAKAGIQCFASIRCADCLLNPLQSTGHRPDGTTSHSTKLANNASQVAGYSPVRRIIRVALIIILIAAIMGISAMAYANWPRNALQPGIKADHVVVLKSERKMLLLSSHAVLREYAISLGSNPAGQKVRKGDGKTPEGSYRIDYRNPQSMAHLSLHISYPKAKDVARAKQQGVPPGGLIMIHGLSNGYGVLGRLHRWYDWTDGCIAVTNDEIEEIWRVVPDGTPIDIRA